MSRSTAATRSPSIATSSRPSCPPPGSTTSPPRISTSNAIAPSSVSRRQRRLDEPARPAAGDELAEQIGALLERAGPRRNPERLLVLGQQLERAREVGIG